VVRDARDEGEVYKGNTGGGGTHWYAGRWTRVVWDGIRGAGSEHGWGELRGTGSHEHARSTVVSTMSRWPPVGGHPAMVVAVEIHLGRTQERSAWEGGGKGARLLFRRYLVALFSLLLASLSCAGFV
jgi:hypothetical protein